MAEKIDEVLKAARRVCALDEACRNSNGERKAVAQKARATAIKTLATAIKALDAANGER